jgi:hypothetical protein
MSELIWLTVPHQLPPVAVWYEDKEKLGNTWQWLQTNSRITKSPIKR